MVTDIFYDKLTISYLGDNDEITITTKSTCTYIGRLTMTLTQQTGNNKPLTLAIDTLGNLEIKLATNGVGFPSSSYNNIITLMSTNLHYNFTLSSGADGNAIAIPATTILNCRNVKIGRLNNEIDDLIAIYNPVSDKPSMTFDGGVVARRPRIQIIVRNKSYLTGYTLAEEIFQMFACKLYGSTSIYPVGDINHIGQDDQKREEFSIFFKTLITV